MWLRIGMLICCGLLISLGAGCSQKEPSKVTNVVYESPHGKIDDWLYEVTRGEKINDNLQMYNVHVQYYGSQKVVNAVEIQFGEGTISTKDLDMTKDLDHTHPIVMGSSLPTTMSHTPLTIKWTIGSVTQSQTIDVKLP